MGIVLESPEWRHVRKARDHPEDEMLDLLSMLRLWSKETGARCEGSVKDVRCDEKCVELVVWR